VAAEGSPYSNILKLMKAQGYNKDNHVTVGKVTSISPLTFSVQGFDLEPGDYIIAERLVEHTRNITIEGTSVTDSQMSVEGYTPHTHNITSFNISEGTLTIKSPLAVDDLVIVLIDEDEFFIMDKVVT
jgi:hypothetical protein